MIVPFRRTIAATSGRIASSASLTAATTTASSSPAPTGGSLSRLSGRLSNLVAVVRPQRPNSRMQESDASGGLRKANLNKVTTTTIKSKPTTKRASESEKTNSNHKDVNSRAKNVIACPVRTKLSTGSANDKRQDYRDEGLKSGSQVAGDAAGDAVEGKQEELIQTVVCHVKEPVTRTKTTTTSGLAMIPKPATRFLKMPSPTTACCLVEAAVGSGSGSGSVADDETGNEEGRFELQNESTRTGLLPVASSSNNYSHGDKNRHGNDKQASNKHLPGHTRLLASKTNNLAKAKLKRQDMRPEWPNNCYESNGHAFGHHEANSNLTKLSAASNVAARDTNGSLSGSSGIVCSNKINHAASGHVVIRDRIPAKPMGRQVLSLMMLNAGLLPANSNHQLQQQAESQKQSHVRLQNETKNMSTPAEDVINLTMTRGDNSNCLPPADNFPNPAASSPIVPMSAYESRVDRLGGGTFIDCEGKLAANRSCNWARTNYHERHELSSLQPINSLLGQDNETRGSISLPSSPRLRNRGRSDGRETNSRVPAVPIDRMVMTNCKVEARDDLDRQRWSALKEHNSYYYRTTAGRLSPVRLEARLAGPLNHQQHSTVAPTNSFCDNQTDSHSLTSSSCSSLNQQHCPPLLALSNQLYGLKFHELIKANSGSSPSMFLSRQKASENTDRQHQDQLDKNTLLSMEQVRQVSKQHETLVSDPNRESELEGCQENSPKEIDHSTINGTSGSSSSSTNNRPVESEQVLDNDNNNKHSNNSRHREKSAQVEDTGAEPLRLADDENLRMLQLRLVL